MFLPDNIEISKSEKYNLTIRITDHNLSFTLFCPENNAYCYRERVFFEDTSLLDNVKQSIFEMSFLTQKYAKTDVIFVSDKYEFIPDYIFENKHTEDLYKLTHSGDIGKVIQSNQMYNDIVTLFDIDSELHNFLVRSLFAPNFHHHSNVLVRFFDQKAGFPSTVNQMFINFCDTYIDVYCFKNQKMIHSSTYRNVNVQDFVYYILNLWNKCKLRQLSDTLQTYGESPIKKEAIEILSEYISHIEPVGQPSVVQLLGSEAEKTPLDLLTFSI